jgi:hypothetical protein
MRCSALVFGVPKRKPPSRFWPFVFTFSARNIAIVNRGTRTSGKKAASYCARGLAEQLSPDSIRMLEPAEIALLQSEIKYRRGLQDPKFAWHVGTSGGSKLMHELEGVSGGVRLWKAGWRKPEAANAT